MIVSDKPEGPGKNTKVNIGMDIKYLVLTTFVQPDYEIILPACAIVNLVIL